MDLGAYAQIEKLDNFARENGIQVPRCRGYRLMEDEEPVAQEQIDEMIRSQSILEAEHLVCIEDFPVCKSPWREISQMTDRRKERYLVMQNDEDGYRRAVGIRWDRFHGKSRKRLKYAIKQAIRRIHAQYGAWNRYAGQKGVLYIHAKLGSTSWTDAETKSSVTSQPWCLVKVDDYWDTSYCDIYARIKVPEVAENDDE